jgi:hypothetical protein
MDREILISVHEAGHALVGAALGIRIKEVCMDPPLCTSLHPPGAPEDLDQALAWAACDLAGSVAESMFAGPPPEGTFRQDLADAAAVIRIVCDPVRHATRCQRMINRASDLAVRTVQRYQPVIDELAVALQLHRKLPGAVVQSYLRRGDQLRREAAEST